MQYALAKVGTSLGITVCIDATDLGTAERALIVPLSGITMYLADPADTNTTIINMAPIGQVGVLAPATDFYYSGSQIDFSMGGVIAAIASIMNAV